MSVASPIPSRARTMTSRSNSIAARLPCPHAAFPLNPRAVPQVARARSSAGEHYVDIVGVTGSIPVAPTIPANRLSAEFHLEAQGGPGKPVPADILLSRAGQSARTARDRRVFAV